MSLCPGEALHPPSGHSSRLRCLVPLSSHGEVRPPQLFSLYGDHWCGEHSSCRDTTGFRWLHQWGKWASWRIKQTEGGSLRLLCLALIGPLTSSRETGRQGAWEGQLGQRTRWSGALLFKGFCFNSVPQGGKEDKEQGSCHWGPEMKAERGQATSLIRWVTQCGAERRSRLWCASSNTQ